MPVLLTAPKPSREVSALDLATPLRSTRRLASFTRGACIQCRRRGSCVHRHYTRALCTLKFMWDNWKSRLKTNGHLRPSKLTHRRQSSPHSQETAASCKTVERDRTVSGWKLLKALKNTRNAPAAKWKRQGGCFTLAVLKIFDSACWKVRNNPLLQFFRRSFSPGKWRAQDEIFWVESSFAMPS